MDDDMDTKRINVRRCLHVFMCVCKVYEILLCTYIIKDHGACMYVCMEEYLYVWLMYTLWI